ncbi:MAG: hypothetical protein PHH59_03815 [Methylovulum sp.]|uniref:hypothetical protein n=1 Tax=Methylovulum sp. TaxID=1916980 RepID=UPI00260CC5C6|nr:hypothetical protein [Methylovulum sp.]MDD2723134.1 hypothetical protein [Methylovulum sp.]MDD5126262.1 hypothetical protein [Methylovulum sp.]
MKTPTPIIFLPLICLLLGINISVAQPLDKSAIKAIDLQIAPAAKLSLPETKTLRAAVIANLSQWRFPLRAENGHAYTHTLTVEVGDSKYDQTPVGFSFSSGNSDPRAPGFQKAYVIPIQCRLTDNANPKQEEQLDMTFSAPSASTGSQKLQETLVDNISSVCFDLLDSLKFLPPPTPAETAASVTKPRWMPSVQVETVPVPQPQPRAENVPAVTLPATTAPVSTAPTTIASPVPATTSPATAGPQEIRKQLIIHNQGTPVIIKFGYDRK